MIQQNKQGHYIDVSLFHSVDLKNDPFTFTNGGIVIMFQEYDYAGYAEGILSYKVPYSVFKQTESCQTPPQTLELPKGIYHLKATQTSLQPGMKIAFMKCENGNFKPGDATDSTVVYSSGNPNDSSDVIVTGNWGKALYSKR